MILKYLGEQVYSIHPKIHAAVTVSAPCDLQGSSAELSKFWNNIYMKRFLVSLKSKLVIKEKQFPNSFIEIEKIKNARNFLDMDNLYTAPAHGFKNAYDYWKKNSSKQFIPSIKTPTLLITSQDDPFLSNSCIPVKEAKNNSNFVLEPTSYGGHVGFNSSFSNKKNHWLEKRIIGFLNDHK
jgi:predicted alpha/beta-fold hydrolase